MLEPTEVDAGQLTLPPVSTLLMPWLHSPRSPNLSHISARCQVNRRGVSPLLHACLCGHAPLARLLLDHGADVGLAANDGQTPLHGAAAGRHIEVLRLLLSRGAVPDPSWTPDELAFLFRAGGLSTPPVPASSSPVPSAARASPGAPSSSAAIATSAAATAASSTPPSASRALSSAPPATAAASSSSTSRNTPATAPSPQPPAARPPKQCAQCGALPSPTTKLSKCSRCQAVRYCGIACRDAHWREGGHKRECRALRVER